MLFVLFVTCAVIEETKKEIERLESLQLALLETDPDLKRELREFAASGLPERSRPGRHSTDSK